MQEHITGFHLSAELVPNLCVYMKFACKVRSEADGHATLAELAYVIHQVVPIWGVCRRRG